MPERTLPTHASLKYNIMGSLGSPLPDYRCVCVFAYVYMCRHDSNIAESMYFKQDGE